jgi:hypothetical protein
VNEQEPDDRGLFANLGERAEFERRKVEHEDMVLDHRLSWLTTSQSIFATAYVLRFTTCVPGEIRIALPAIAFVTCVLFNVGIRAAIAASRQVTTCWDNTHERHKGELLAHPGKRERGWWPAKTVPFFLMAVWLAALSFEIGHGDCGVHPDKCVKCDQASAFVSVSPARATASRS